MAFVAERPAPPGGFSRLVPPNRKEILNHVEEAQGKDDEIVYHIDVSTLTATPLFRLLDNGITFGEGIEGLDVDDAGRTIYFTTGRGSPSAEVLYSAHYDDLDLNNPGRLRARKVADLTYAGERPRLSGLAWNSALGKLYTCYEFGVTAVNEGIYEINPATGAMTLVYDIEGTTTQIALSGLAYYPANGLLYTTNTDTGDQFLYSIDLGQPVATGFVQLPNAPITSIDESLAISNDDCGPAATVSCENLAYIIPSNGSVDIKVYNIATDTLLAPLTVTPWAATDNASGGGWGPNALVQPAGANFCSLMTAEVDPINEIEANTGSQINVTVRDDNCGPDSAPSGTYVITLSGSAAASCTITNLISSSGQAVESIEDVEISATVDNFGGGIFNGYSEVVNFTITTASPGDLVVTATWNPNGATDPYLVNNTETLGYTVRVFPDAAALFWANLATIGGSSPIPGSGLNWKPLSSGSSTAFYSLNRSPSGQYIGIMGLADHVEDDVIVYGDTGVYSLIVQENTTPSPDGALFDSQLLTPRLSLNDAGQLAFANDTTGPITTDETICVYDGAGGFTLVAQELGIVPAFSLEGYTYDTDMDSANVNGAGQVAFRLNDLFGAPTGEDEILLGNNGATVLSQEGVTVPTGQLVAPDQFWENLDAEQFWTDAAGVNWMARGDLYGPTASDGVLVVNGQVILQEGQVVPGLTGTQGTWSTTYHYGQMYSNGDWSWRGTTSDADEDFIMIGNGATTSIFARLGDEIVVGSGEHWDDAESAGTFIEVARNNQGDTIIMGHTDHPDAGRETVAVFYRAVDGTRSIIVRENDPVDLDDNGLFDDNVWLKTFLLDDAPDAVLTDSGEFLAIIEYRDSNDPSSSGSIVGKAVLKMQVNASPVATGADVLVTKIASTNLVPAVGQPITYTITVANTGPQDATHVIINDTLPAEVVFSSATAPLTETSPGVVSGNIGTVPAFGGGNYEIVVKTIAEGTAINNVTVSADQTDPDTGNNTSQATTTIENQADVSVTKVDDGGAPLGVNFTYTITLSNAGPAPATNVLMVDTLDANTEFVSATNGAVENPLASGNVEATFASIPSGGQQIVEITVKGLGAVNFVAHNDVVVSATEVDLDPGNNAAFTDTLIGDVADIQVTKADDGYALVGNNITYSITVYNDGPGTATNVDLVDTLPVGLVFVSGSHGATEVPPASGNIEVTIPSIASQTAVVVTLVANAPTAGQYTNVAMVDAALADQIDPDDSNNTGIAITRVGDFRSVDVIFSEIAGHPTAEVIGAKQIGGTPVFAEFTAITYLTGSQDGSRWVLRGTTNQASNESDVLLLGAGDSGSVFQQEGQVVSAPGSLATDYWSFFDSTPVCGFDSAGNFAFTGRVRENTHVNLGSPDNERVFAADINTLSIVEIIREGDLLFGLVDDPGNPTGDETLGNSVSATHLLDNGNVRFHDSATLGIHTTYRPILLEWDSVLDQATGFRQPHVDLVPGSANFYDTFDLGDFGSTPDGAHWFAQGEEEVVSTTTDDILVVDDAVVLRESSATDGVVVSAALFTTMLSDGTWLTRADQSPTANGDVVFRNGLAVAKTGDPVAGGAEAWGLTLTQAAGNTNGDYLVTGNTDIGDTDFDYVMVQNGTDLVIREGDPVDLDGNGKFDDGVFLSTFNADDIFYTDHQVAYFLATLRNSEGTSLGDAFLRINVGCPTITGDLNGDNNLNGLDIQAFVDCMLAGGSPAGQCKCGDFDMDDDVDFDDMDKAIALWLGQ